MCKNGSYDWLVNQGTFLEDDFNLPMSTLKKMMMMNIETDSIYYYSPLPLLLPLSLSLCLWLCVWLCVFWVLTKLVLSFESFNGLHGGVLCKAWNFLLVDVDLYYKIHWCKMYCWVQINPQQFPWLALKCKE
jgi:hypothetical protein